MLLSRRAFVIGSSAALPFALASGAASARGRVPLGGRIAMHVPWPLGGVDPHRLDDAGAAIFGDALFDTLYVRDEAGAIAPSLAEAEPEVDGAALRVVLRAGLRSAHGRAIFPRDVAASIVRARALGAKAWLADVPTPKIDDAGHALVFAMRDAARLTRALASPLVAVVPLAFHPSRPDGTGPMRADRRTDALVLTRNALAARGASILDEIVVGDAKDLLTSLRSFQSGADDLGWLGSGLYEPRKGSVPFDAGAVAWAILRTGKDAGAEWSAPGVAQSVCDAIPHSALKALVLGAEWTSTGKSAWAGAPVELLVRDDSAWLMELGKTMSGVLTSPSHEVTLKPVPQAELAQRRASRTFALALDVARPLAGGSLGAYAGLATADDPSSAVDAVRHAPRGEMPVRAMTRTMRIGVVGEVRVQGSRMPDIALPLSPPTAGVDWGAASRGGKTR